MSNHLATNQRFRNVLTQITGALWVGEKEVKKTYQCKPNPLYGKPNPDTRWITTNKGNNPLWTGIRMGIDFKNGNIHIAYGAGPDSGNAYNKWRVISRLIVDRFSRDTGLISEFGRAHSGSSNKINETFYWDISGDINRINNLTGGNPIITDTAYMNIYNKVKMLYSITNEVLELYSIMENTKE